MSPAALAVKNIYFNAVTHENMMLAACPTEEERNAVRQEIGRAQSNWIKVQNQSFHDNDPALVSLVSQANAVAVTLQHIDEQLGDFSKVLAAITQGVAYGTEIASRILPV